MFNASHRKLAAIPKLNKNKLRESIVHIAKSNNKIDKQPVGSDQQLLTVSHLPSATVKRNNKTILSRVVS